VLTKNSATDYDTGWATPPTPVSLPVHTIHPNLQATAAALPGANWAIFWKSLGAGTITNIGLQVNASSGNICVGVYNSASATGPPTSRLATSGSIPCPAIGWASISLGGSYSVNQSHFLALAASSASATFYSVSSTWASGGLGQYAAGLAYSDNSSGLPLPATANPNGTIRQTIIFMSGL